MCKPFLIEGLGINYFCLCLQAFDFLARSIVYLQYWIHLPFLVNIFSFDVLSIYIILTLYCRIFEQSVLHRGNLQEGKDNYIKHFTRSFQLLAQTPFQDITSVVYYRRLSDGKNVYPSSLFRCLIRCTSVHDSVPYPFSIQLLHSFLSYVLSWSLV